MEATGKTPTGTTHELKLGINYPVPYVQLFQSKGDQIRWVSDDGKPFLIVFEEGSPFDRWYFELAATRGATVDSMQVRRSLKIPDIGLEFKYSIISDGWKVDPKTGVRP